VPVQFAPHLLRHVHYPTGTLVVDLVVLDQGIDTSTTVGRMFF